MVSATSASAEKTPAIPSTARRFQAPFSEGHQRLVHSMARSPAAPSSAHRVSPPRPPPPRAPPNIAAASPSSGSAFHMGEPSLSNCPGNGDHLCLLGGSCATGSDHRRPQEPATARLAGRGGAVDRRSAGHGRDQAADPARQGVGVALLAGGLHRRRRGWSVARQNPAVADAEARGRDGGGGDPSDAGGSTAGWAARTRRGRGVAATHSVDRSGERDAAFGLVLPIVSTKAMPTFLDQFGEQVAPKAHALAPVDRAGRHSAGDLVIPVTPTPIFLPPHLPELDAIERFWLHLEERLRSHRLRDDHDAIDDAVCTAWQRVTSNAGRIRSLCSMEWATTVRNWSGWVCEWVRVGRGKRRRYLLLFRLFVASLGLPRG